jgi:ubiquinone/menaquinone biosynthesis C-methylase UbiE
VALYDIIGTDYDSTRRADPRIVGRFINLLKLDPGEVCLDLACGTGNYSLAVASKSRCEFFAVDQSIAMIRRAAVKDRSVAWCVGEAEALPFMDSAFAGVMCVLAVHHFQDLHGVFTEAFRVLRSGRLVIFTAAPAQMRGYWLNRYFPWAMEKSIRQMPTLRTMQRGLRSAGFREVETETYEVERELEDLFLYSGKHRPEMYLDSRVRKGISTFANLADAEEIEEGCRRLAIDLEKGRFKEVINNYGGEAGDYLFLAARK